MILPHRAKVLWALVPLLAFLFACFVGRAWPVQTGASFPVAVDDPARPVATAAHLSIYSPDERTMLLQTEFQVDEPDQPPPPQLSIARGPAMEPLAVETQPTGIRGRIKAAVPLPLAPGLNRLTFALGAPGALPAAFFVKSVHVTQNIFNAGNLLFCLTLTAVVAGSILAARALAINGLGLFCAAPLIGFLLLTSSATLLSLAHLLTGGIWSAVLLAAAAVLGAASVFRLRRNPLPAVETAPENRLRPLEAIVLLALACPVFMMQCFMPITRWDDLMYHGSRAGYWMQNASALPFVSHNDRLSVFPIGGDLLYAFGTMVSGAEPAGKFLVGLSYPLILFAMLALLKNAGARSWVCLGIVTIFATTPLVLLSGVGIKPDLWLVLLGVVSLHWVLAARRGHAAAGSTTASCLAAAAAGAAFGIKWTAAPLLLLLPFALLLPGWKQQWARQWWPAMVAFAVALALGGAGPILWFNLRTSHHPFGPKSMRQWHQPNPGLHPVLVQLKRLPFLLFTLPYVPGETTRQALEQWETSVAGKVGATEPLWREGDGVWPGLFVPKVSTMNHQFSLGWIIVALGLIRGSYTFRQPADRDQRAAFWLISALSLVFILAVATQVRWQSIAEVPDRFLLPALAFGLIAVAWPANRLIAGSKAAAVLLGAIIALHALPWGTFIVTPFRSLAAGNWQTPLNGTNTSDVSAISRRLLPGRTILLLADQSCQDYPLFRARDGFANRVLPWGKAAYDPAAFDGALHQRGVDTVILTSPDFLNMLWDPPVDARPFVQDMDARPDFKRLPGTDEVVVYIRNI